MNRIGRGVVHLWVYGLMAIVVVALLFFGCRKFSNNPPADTQVTVNGSYVGQGDIDGSTTNVSLALVGPDTAGHYRGAIGYHSALDSLTGVTRDSTGDTLRFGYRRNNVSYLAWSVVSSTGLLVQFTQPTGIAHFRLNREIDGFNLSGAWHGAAYSSHQLQTNNAAMNMDQEGALFIGTLDVTWPQSAHFNISSGTYNQNSFQLSGTMQVLSTSYPALLIGGFANRDSVAGTWQAGVNGEADGGSFYFARSFQ